MTTTHSTMIAINAMRENNHPPKPRNNNEEILSGRKRQRRVPLETLPQKIIRRTLQPKICQTTLISTSTAMAATSNNGRGSRARRSSAAMNINNVMEGEDDSDPPTYTEMECINTTNAYYLSATFVTGSVPLYVPRKGFGALMESPNRRPSPSSPLGAAAGRCVRWFDLMPYRYDKTFKWGEKRAFLLKVCYHIARIGDLPTGIKEDGDLCPAKVYSQVQVHHGTSIENLWCMAIYKVAYGPSFPIAKMGFLNARLNGDKTKDVWKRQIHHCFVVPFVVQLVNDLTHLECLGHTSVNRLLASVNASSFASTVIKRMKNGGVFSEEYLLAAQDTTNNDVDNVDEHPYGTQFLGGVNVRVLKLLALCKKEVFTKTNTTLRQLPVQQQLLLPHQLHEIGGTIGASEDLPVGKLFR